LGIAQRKLGQPAMAVSAYKEAIRIDPVMAEAYQNLANVYLEMNNFQLAILNFNKALEIRPEFEKAQTGLNRAEDALEQSKKIKNPFGRLVDPRTLEAATANAVAAPSESHPLERRRVHELSHELNLLTEDFRDLTKSQLEPRLHELQKIVAEGRVSGLALARAVTEFQESFELWQQRGREVRQRATELGDILS
jgi:tetratricopeptide (TPR) repeat protein